MALAAGVAVTAFLDDRLAGQRIRERPVLAPADAPKGAHFAVAIAEPHARRSLSAKLEGLGLTPMSLVHPRAVVAPATVLGGGNLVQANTYVSSSVHTGAHCQIHYNATVGHDTVLDDFVSVFPGANVAGSVRLGAGSTIGSNAVGAAGHHRGCRSLRRRRRGGDPGRRAGLCGHRGAGQAVGHRYSTSLDVMRLRVSSTHVSG